MPPGAVDGVKILALDDEGFLEFGEMEFVSAGTYVWEIRELFGGIWGWDYDPVVYVLTYIIGEGVDGLYVIDRVVEVNADYDVEEWLAFLNRYDPNPNLEGKVLVEGVKTWEHRTNWTRDWPGSITVVVLGNGEWAAQQVVTAGMDWAYRFVLPELDGDGEPIVYTVREVSVPGYLSVVNGWDLHNIYVGEERTGDPTGTGTDPTGPSTDPTGPSTDPTGPTIDPTGPTGPSTDPTGPTSPTGPKTGPTGPKTDVPYTGDPNASMNLWLALMGLCLIGLLVALIMYRKVGDIAPYIGKYQAKGAYAPSHQSPPGKYALKK
jgi:hypothetical protein